jgi:NAD+ synthase (glutamine-hydrolysing)
MSIVRLALAQIRPAKGDYAANLAHLGDVFKQIANSEPKIDLLITPETITSGYFVEGGVREVAVTAGTLAKDLQSAHATSGAPPLDVAVGFYEVFQNHHYNSCLYATLGGKKPVVRHVHRKVFLPTYGVFDEERFVERGQSIEAFDTSWGRAAILICEDAWHSVTATIAALDGAQLLIVPSAPPARGLATEQGVRLPVSVVRWERIVRGLAEEHGVYVALCTLVGFEGGKGFPGASVLVNPQGEVETRGPLFEEAVVKVDMDLDALTRARADSPLLADLRAQLPHLLKGLGKKRKDTKPTFDAAPDGTKPVKSVIRNPQSAIVDPLALDPALAKQWLVSFLKDEVVRRRGFTKGIVGLSGGVDSALTAFLAAEALGKENVIGVRMPYRTSSPDSLEHAKLVGDTLGIKIVTIDISAAVDGYLAQVEKKEPVTPGRKGNVMSRERMIVLFDLSAKYNALPLGTGNKTERLLGYFTWHADDSPPVNPLGDLFKTQVWALARHVGVPEAIVSKPATADLIHGQTDEGDFGLSYAKADQILYCLITGAEPKGFTTEEVGLVRKRLDSTHWKRRGPTVAVMSQTAIGEFYLRPVDY